MVPSAVKQQVSRLQKLSQVAFYVVDNFFPQKFQHVDDKDASEVLDANGGGGGFAIHLYNHMKSFARKSLSVHRSSLMHRIFRQFCPRAEEVMLRPILGKEYQP